MSPTVTKPLDDKEMWRKTLARTHPDAGGDNDLFVWIQVVRDAMCNGGGSNAKHRPPQREPRPEPPSKPEPQVIYEDGRVPFPNSADFDALTAKALDIARQNRRHPIAKVLRLLKDCASSPHLREEEGRASTYKQCAYAAHLAGLNRKHRREWYALCEYVPLSQRHLGHLIKKLKEEEAP